MSVPPKEFPQDGPIRPSPRRKRRRWLIDIAIALAVFSAVSMWQGRHLRGSGQPAPSFALSTMDGEQVDLEALRGRKVLLYFWAPWCGVCKVVGSNVAAIAEAQEEVAVLSIALGYRSEREVEAAIAEHGLGGTILLGGEKGEEIADAYGVRAFPTVYFVDEEGTIRRSTLGYVSKLGLRLRLLFT